MTYTSDALFTERQAFVRRLLGVAEIAITVGILFFLSHALIPLLIHGSADDSMVNPIPPLPVERYLSWLMYLFVILQWAIRPGMLLKGLFRNPFIPALVCLAAISAIWSVNTYETVRSAFALGMATLLGVYLGCRYSLQGLLRLLAVALGLGVVLSLYFGVFIPDIGVAHGFNEGAWQGAFTQKNVLGQTMVLAATVFALLANRRPAFRAVNIAITGSALVLILLSRSTTAALECGSLAVVGILAILIRRGHRSAAALLVTCLLSVILIVTLTYRERVLGTVGKDATLTGRTALWSAVSKRIAERPILGYGYGAFWSGSSGPWEDVVADIGFFSPHSHNGFLDLLLDFGAAGSAVFVGAFVFVTRRSWIAFRQSTEIDTAWPIVFLVLIVLSDVTESTISQSYLAWALFVAMGACVNRTVTRAPFRIRLPNKAPSR